MTNLYSVLWWASSVTSGLAVGMAVGVIVVLGCRKGRLKGEPSWSPWQTFGQFSLLGLMLGAVGGYLMGWFGEELPNWPLRYLSAGVLGGSLSALGAPGMRRSPAGWIPLPGLLAGLLSASVVWWYRSP